MATLAIHAGILIYNLHHRAAASLELFCDDHRAVTDADQASTNPDFIPLARRIRSEPTDIPEIDRDAVTAFGFQQRDQVLAIGTPHVHAFGLDDLTLDAAAPRLGLGLRTLPIVALPIVALAVHPLSFAALALLGAVTLIGAGPAIALVIVVLSDARLYREEPEGQSERRRCDAFLHRNLQSDLDR
ncbi:hypothetical protein [Candidatus Laterigemmans baculatus]|uniref:hypothetical protein n=1 Tax=Candidatus Laterigemmans baculatus TaxID=2770505 RepID=UPI0013DBFB16